MTVSPADFSEIETWFRQGRHAEAAAGCAAVLMVQPQHVQAHYLLSLILAGQGRSREALESIERAIRLDPRSPPLRAACASILLDLDRLDEADAAVRAGLAFDPRAANLLDLQGVIRLRRGDTRGAEECFLYALQCSPAYSAARGNLALLYERSNHLEEGLQVAQQGLALNPGDVTLRLVLGRCQRRRGDYAGARSTLAGLANLPARELRHEAEYELALCADLMGDARAAFEHSRRANALAREISPQVFPLARIYAEHIQALHRQFTPEWIASWRELPAQSAVPPIFLFGFPRSGTTLLDSMLGSHPDVAVLEEIDTTKPLVDSVMRLPGGYPAALKDLLPGQRQTLVREYFRVATANVPRRKYLLDKSPFHTVHAGLIQRVFPDAPLLFMARHPCDVVWSCYMTNFKLNHGTAHFTALDSTVALYCAVLALWRRYVDGLRPHYRLVRYEDLIENPEGELRAITRFLQLPWSDALLHYPEHVAERGRINSASYAQVSRPLYHSARGRWQRYTHYLEPFFPQLRPWCEFFGYSL